MKERDMDGGVCVFKPLHVFWHPYVKMSEKNNVWKR